MKIGGPGIPPEGLPLALKKGEYVAKVFPLKFTTEQFAAINGAGRASSNSPLRRDKRWC